MSFKAQISARYRYVSWAQTTAAFQEAEMETYPFVADICTHVHRSHVSEAFIKLIDALFFTGVQNNQRQEH